MTKLAIISTHPIQYNAPLFRMLAQDDRLAVKVFYTLGKQASDFIDPGFKRNITWDIPLLEGYDYQFLPNTSSKPSTGSFRGIVNQTLIHEIEKFGATHLLVYGWAFHSHLCALRYFSGKIMILFRGDSTLLDEKPGIKTMLRRLWLKWVYTYIDVALYVGGNNKAYYLKHGVPNTKLAFAPHAIDNVRFSHDSHNPKAIELKQQLKISSDKKVFLFAGKFEWKKNPMLLVKAFLKLDSDDTVLVLVGNGPLELEVKALANGCERIKFLPFQNQSIMPAIYRIGDVLILPSVTETWGLSLNEAMACGLPLVVSDKVGGAIDLIDIGKNGCIFKSDNVIELSETLAELSQLSKEELKEMGRYSRTKISDWSYQKGASAIINNILN